MSNFFFHKPVSPIHAHAHAREKLVRRYRVVVLSARARSPMIQRGCNVRRGLHHSFRINCRDHICENRARAVQIDNEKDASEILLAKFRRHILYSEGSQARALEPLTSTRYILCTCIESTHEIFFVERFLSIEIIE